MRTMYQFVDVFECVVGGHNLFGMEIMEFVEQRPLVRVSLKAKFADQALKPQCVIADLVRIASILCTLELVPLPFQGCARSGWGVFLMLGGCKIIKEALKRLDHSSLSNQVI